MSTTPRTSAMIDGMGLRCTCSEQPIELCLQLETKLNAARQENQRLREALQTCVDTFTMAESRYLDFDMLTYTEGKKEVQEFRGECFTSRDIANQALNPAPENPHVNNRRPMNEETNTTDPYAHLKSAHAVGKVIECNIGVSTPQWVTVSGPVWEFEAERYRIKPDPAEDECWVLLDREKDTKLEGDEYFHAGKWWPMGCEVGHILGREYVYRRRLLKPTLLKRVEELEKKLSYSIKYHSNEFRDRLAAEAERDSLTSRLAQAEKERNEFRQRNVEQGGIILALRQQIASKEAELEAANKHCEIQKASIADLGQQLSTPPADAPTEEECIEMVQSEDWAYGKIDFPELLHHDKRVMDQLMNKAKLEEWWENQKVYQDDSGGSETRQLAVFAAMVILSFAIPTLICWLS